LLTSLQHIHGLVVNYCCHYQTYMPQSVTKQYDMVLAKRQWCTMVWKITSVILAIHHRLGDICTCGLQACNRDEQPICSYAV